MLSRQHSSVESDQLVTKVTFSERAGGVLAFHLPDGSVFTASKELFREALNHSATSVVPAAPGTYELHDSVDDGKLLVSRTAIIAWVIDSVGDVTPLTAASCGTPHNYCPTILHPDGSVDHILSHHASYDQWLTYVQEQGVPMGTQRRVPATTESQVAPSRSRRKAASSTPRRTR